MGGHQKNGERTELRVQKRFCETDTGFVESRRHPRYELDVAINIYVRSRQVIRGHTVDISESGVSAMLIDEIPLGEVVRLECTLPFGEIEVLAVARQRNAFRYGFEFLKGAAAQEVIKPTCRKLAIEKALFERQPE
jgi:PilZ domain